MQRSAAAQARTIAALYSSMRAATASRLAVASAEASSAAPSRFLHDGLLFHRATACGLPCPISQRWRRSGTDITRIVASGTSAFSRPKQRGQSGLVVGRRRHVVEGRAAGVVAAEQHGDELRLRLDHLVDAVEGVLHVAAVLRGVHDLGFHAGCRGEAQRDRADRRVGPARPRRCGALPLLAAGVDAEGHGVAEDAERRDLGRGLGRLELVEVGRRDGAATRTRRGGSRRGGRRTPRPSGLVSMPSMRPNPSMSSSCFRLPLSVELRVVADDLVDVARAHRRGRRGLVRRR